MKSYSLLIDGAPVTAQASFESEDPFQGKPWALIPRATAQHVDAAVEAAYRALHQGPWSGFNATQRGALLRRLGDLLAEHSETLASTEVRDNGKLLSDMRKQLSYEPQVFYYYAGLADKIEGSLLPSDKADILNFTRHEPVGVVAIITAWNAPINLLAKKLAPALAAGCTVVVKPSEHASASTLELATLIEKAGFPNGVVNVVTGFGDEVGSPLVSHSKVSKVAFTGSENTGKRVYELAARSLKKVTLELGGKSPNIVFPDANLENAANGVVAGVFAASGQTCIAGARLLVHRSILEEFSERVKSVAAGVRMGNPMDLDTELGPIANRQQFEKIRQYLDIARSDGAELLLGGKRAERPECGDGLFIEPTIYARGDNQMRIAREEIFGPVLVIIPFDDDEQAIAIANDSPYGLAAGVWTNDMRRMVHMSGKLQVGTVWINTYRAVSFMSPFGGYKASGIGRENGREAIYAYLQTKSVWLSTATNVPNPFIMR
ncbi:aldehyde dehydrogenase [Sinorhizobium medicae]|uniref:aldehyde dehydrogenase n=1 Tax=Sinorhizobium medicae TaxID=110321 RepID=UPI000FD6F426|nr:aldehyde dehydrogenase [Sinorhizobium medicae]RVO73533.1 aldehyde dehydrogenase [Sinorhizobium medicae]